MKLDRIAISILDSTFIPLNIIQKKKKKENLIKSQNW